MRFWGKNDMVSWFRSNPYSARPLNALRRYGRRWICIIPCWDYEVSNICGGVFIRGLLSNLHEPQIFCEPRVDLRTVHEPGPVSRIPENNTLPLPKIQIAY
ncbi:unnamed protein product [Laminaria digitata]